MMDRNSCFRSYARLVLIMSLLFGLVGGSSRVLCVQDGKCLSLEVGDHQPAFHGHHGPTECDRAERGYLSIGGHHHHIHMVLAAVLGKTRISSRLVFESLEPASFSNLACLNSVSGHILFTPLNSVHLSDRLAECIDTIRLLL